MYRPDVFGQAFARSQLKRLDEMNAIRTANAAILSERLEGIPGVETPRVPDDRTSAWYNYVLGVHPEPLGLDLDAATFRAKVQEALAKEGVSCGQWQRLPVPGQDVFQLKHGFGRGWPWTPAEREAGVEYVYRGEDYPNSLAFIDRHFYLHGIWPPNGEELMNRVADAVEKVFERVEELV
jgi:dTDP-4-amino-4,6-dideoxygalactose transaminase